MARYIEIVGELAGFPRYELTDADMRSLTSVGPITRENVAWWLLNARHYTLYLVEYGLADFHAVIDEVDIPWADPEMAQVFAQAQVQMAKIMAEIKARQTPH